MWPWFFFNCSKSQGSTGVASGPEWINKECNKTIRRGKKDNVLWISRVLSKRSYASQVNLLEFPEGVTGHVKREIQHIRPISISKTPSVLLLIKTSQETDHQCSKTWEKDGKKRAGFKQSFYCEKKAFSFLEDWHGIKAVQHNHKQFFYSTIMQIILWEGR